jgi:hypothetical protein
MREGLRGAVLALGAFLLLCTLVPLAVLTVYLVPTSPPIRPVLILGSMLAAVGLEALLVLVVLERLSCRSLLGLLGVLFIGLVLLVGPVPHFFVQERGASKVHRCASNLKRIVYACHLYSTDNSEKLPQDLGSLFPRYIRDSTVYICPAVRGRLRAYEGPEAGRIPDRHISYCYVSGLKATDRPDYVLAFDEEWNHDGRGIYVLRVGGSVEWVADIKRLHEELRRQADELRAKGRGMQLLRPSWSRHPGRPVYP